MTPAPVPGVGNLPGRSSGGEERPERLFLITRADLRPGQQAVQAAHALRQYGAEHPESDREWFEGSNTLALLAVPDERALKALVSRAFDRGLKMGVFEEPDLGGQVTAVALEPSSEARRLCRSLPLALGG
jgi:hypothetical protein